MIIVPGVIHQESWYTTTKIPGDYLIVTILLLSTYATGNDSRLLRKRVSFLCTKA